ncbi:MAG TPA: hypothetical protein VH683_01450 [Thermoleophilaceae bacterium]|jgi:hypothetical protein
MRGERGQASVEWIGLLLLVALALTALARFAPHADGRSVASAVLEPAAGRSPPTPANVPFLLPGPRTAAPSPRRRSVRVPRVPREVGVRARRVAVRAWQKAWLACLFYERIRYNLLHPESRIPGHRIPASEILRMLNDCISPVDLVRDWPLLHGQSAGGP